MRTRARTRPIEQSREDLRQLFQSLAETGRVQKQFANQLQGAPSILSERNVIWLSFERVFGELAGNGGIIHDEDTQLLNQQLLG